MQIPTMVYGRRPFGVGLLIAGYDVSFLTFVTAQKWLKLLLVVLFDTIFYRFCVSILFQVPNYSLDPSKCLDSMLLRAN